MRRTLPILFIALFFNILSNASAQQTSGGGTSDGVKNACEISGGTFTGTESGNWACCWDDWGCYGCVNSVCKIKCHNARCRKANAAAKLNPDVKPVPGLAPHGMKAPIAPRKITKLPKNNNQKLE